MNLTIKLNFDGYIYRTNLIFPSSDKHMIRFLKGIKNGLTHNTECTLLRAILEALALNKQEIVFSINDSYQDIEQKESFYTWINECFDVFDD